MTADGNNKPGGLANALRVEVSTRDAVRLLDFGLSNTTAGQRVVQGFDLGRRQPVIVHVLLDAATLDILVRLDGAVDFGPSSATCPHIPRLAGMTLPGTVANAR